MTSRDLYAAFVGLSGGFAVQSIVVCMSRIQASVSICLITLMLCFLISVVKHVTAIVRQHATTPVGTSSKSMNELASVIAHDAAHSAKRFSHRVPMTPRADDDRSARAVALAVSQ
jgi:hypothetical protein